MVEAGVSLHDQKSSQQTSSQKVYLLFVFRKVLPSKLISMSSILLLLILKIEMSRLMMRIKLSYWLSPYLPLTSTLRKSCYMVTMRLSLLRMFNLIYSQKKEKLDLEVHSDDRAEGLNG